ncbi:MAG: type II toxin-antitoxin system HigB family toxin [Cyanobacteria bacterium]|nr:type II toxin-antitoxin system HigB family toxin [Cyanobacteriota bacterium]
MRVIAKRTLIQFWENNSNYEDARVSLEAWYQEAKHAKWLSPTDVKAKYRNASILKGGRVIFNIAGNKYRLVVSINFDTQIIYIRFVGTHKQYDTIDPETI